MSSRRFLFVDDEERVLEGIENLLFDAPEDWHFSFAVGGHSALEMLSQSSYDVLITDMCMPRMDGLALLREVRERYPEMTRVVLSGHTSEGAAQEAMSFVHEFLSKPCDADVLLSTLERCAALSEQSRARDFRRAVGNIGCLPSRPEMYHRVLTMLDRGASLSDVAEVAGSEMAIATKLLHVANTAFYSRGRPIVSVRDAVSRLGGTTTAALVAAVETYENVPSPSWLDVESLHQHSQHVALLAGELCPKAMSSEVMLSCLLHDVGVLLLGTHFPEETQRAVHLANTTEATRDGAEREVLGFDHAAMGGHLIRLWNISDDVAEAVEQHHSPGIEQRSGISLWAFAVDHAVHYQQGAEPASQDLTATERDAVDQARALIAAGEIG